MDNLYPHLRANIQYKVEVEIICGSSGTNSRTGEIYNCKRRVRVYEDREKRWLEEIVVSGVKFDSETEKRENLPESREEFYKELQRYLSNKSKPVGVKAPILTIKNNTFIIDGMVYHGKMLSGREAAARFGDLAAILGRA